ncbi:MAG: hypothetical protein QUS08_07605 [Methanothrix sp.]|nr:hypothetical protein [Methanothrix sp.]
MEKTHSSPRAILLQTQATLLPLEWQPSIAIKPKLYVIMAEGVVQFEAELQSIRVIRSRLVCEGSEGPWIEGDLEDLMVHFTYAGWTAYNLGCAISLLLTSHDEELGRKVSDMMSMMISALGATQLLEIRLTPEALDEIKRDRIEP